jgi:hypothetical protein
MFLKKSLSKFLVIVGSLNSSSLLKTSFKSIFGGVIFENP